MARIGVVGAGVAAAGVCTALAREWPDADVTVLEATDAIGGRAATRTRGGCTYDYGANYLTDDDERVAALVREVAGTDGLVDVDGPVYTFDRDGAVSAGDDRDDHKWTYEDGIAELPRRLLAATDAEIRRETRVVDVRRAPSDDDSGERGAVASGRDDRWLLVDADGTAWGSFDAVALTPPAPAAAEILRRSDEHAGASDGYAGANDERADVNDEHAGASDRASSTSDAWHSDLTDALAAVPYRSIYSAVCGYEVAIERPYYALVNVDREHAVGWIAREECKAGHVPTGQTVLVVQASPAWTREHADAPEGEKQRELAALAADVIGDERLAEPAWTDGHEFRSALPDDAVETEPVAAARERGVHCAGDWVAGEGRLHAAIRSGLETGERIAAEV